MVTTHGHIPNMATPMATSPLPHLHCGSVPTNISRPCLSCHHHSCVSIPTPSHSRVPVSTAVSPVRPPSRPGPKAVTSPGSPAWLCSPTRMLKGLPGTWRPLKRRSMEWTPFSRGRNPRAYRSAGHRHVTGSSCPHVPTPPRPHTPALAQQEPQCISGDTAMSPYPCVLCPHAPTHLCPHTPWRNPSVY